jgi:uncharacterized protein with HEPN domain
MYDIEKVDRNIELFILDIYIAILKIRHTSNNFTNVQDLLYDYRSWDSVIREFEIIGEASKYLLKGALLAKEYQEIVDFRNQITHEYFGIDQNVVWAIIHKDLDMFEEVIIDLINAIENDLKVELIDAFKEDNRYLDFVVKELEALSVSNEK